MTRQERAIAILKSISQCPICGESIHSTYDKNNIHEVNDDYLKKQSFLIRFECVGDLYVNSDGEINNYEPCSLALMEKASDLNDRLNIEEVSS